MRALLALFVFLSLAFGQSELELAVFAEANAARERAGLRPLAFYPELYQAARAHGLDMLRRGYFAHVGPGGPNLRERLWRAGVYELKVAENLYERRSLYLPSDFAREAVQGWLDSPGHRKNLLDPDFTHMAVAVVTGDRRFIAVQEFAYRPFPLELERVAGVGEALELELKGHARRPLRLVWDGRVWASLPPGPVDYRAVLPHWVKPVLVYEAGGYFREASCPADCERLGVRLRLGRRTREGFFLKASLPPRRVLAYFGEEPRYLREFFGPFELFAPRDWRFFWLGEGRRVTHQVPLYEPIFSLPK